MVSRDAYGPRWSSLHQCSTCCSSSLPSLCTATSTRRWDFLVGFETPSSQVIPKTKRIGPGDSITPVPICWLSTLAERLWTPPASEKVAQEACEKNFQVSSFHPKLHKSYHSPWNQCEIISKCHLKSGYIIHISYRFSRSYTPRIQRRDLFAICPGLIMFIVIANL